MTAIAFRCSLAPVLPVPPLARLTRPSQAPLTIIRRRQAGLSGTPTSGCQHAQSTTLHSETGSARIRPAMSTRTDDYADEALLDPESTQDEHSRPSLQRINTADDDYLSDSEHSRIRKLLYVSHFLSTWNSRVLGFAILTACVPSSTRFIHSKFSS